MSKKVLERVPIFIGSPGNLITERKIFWEVIDRVNKIKAKAKGRLLEAVGWEDTLPGKGRPQGKINKDVERADLVVMLLWKRWGSKTDKYSSGFEEEYEVARANGKDIWFYFRSIPDDMMADPGKQVKKIIAFRDKIEREKQYLYRQYENEDTWRELLLDDLCRWLDDLPPFSWPPEPPDTGAAEYEGRIQHLETKLQQLSREQANTAHMLAKEAQNFADSGLITKAQEYYSRATSTFIDLSIINDYGLFLYRIGLIDKARQNFESVLSIAEVSDDKTGMAVAYGNLGLLYQTRGELEKAEELYNKSLEINKKLGHKEGMAVNYCNLGILYEIRGKLEKAEKMCNKSLEIYKKLGHKEGMADGYGSLGNLYQTRGELEKAEELYNKSLAINRELGCKGGMASDYGNLGNLCYMRGELEMAEEMYLKSLEIEKELGRKEGMADDYGNLGILYEIRGKLEKAEEMHNKSLEINRELGRKEGMANQYCNLGNLYQTRGELEKAKEFYEKSLQLFEEVGVKPRTEHVRKLLENLKKKGN